MNKRQRYIIFIPIILLLFLGNIACFAQNVTNSRDTVSTDSITASDENFVIASVLIASPGEDMVSSFGHACLRLQCPTHKLDFIFSMETEKINDDTYRFIAGRVQTRTMAIPTAEYLSQYRKQGRSVTEYSLNLPIQTKQELWKQMDERLEEPSVAYDFLNSGCAQNVLQWMEDVIGTNNMQYGVWDNKWERSRKEIAGECIYNPWYRAIAYCLLDGNARTEKVPYTMKVMMPADLVEVLQHAKAYGKPLLSKKGTVIVRQTKTIEYSWFTPLMLAILILIIAAANMRMHLSVVRYGIITVAMLLGALVYYLVLLSDLCCTEFNWLLVPLSPLPLLLWRWKRKVLPLIIAVNIIWCICMIPYVKIAIDWEMIVFTLALTTTYLETFNKNKKLN